MILVTGATGHFGKATIDFLLKKLPAASIAALARGEQKAADLSAKGVDVRIGDYTDYDSLVSAFKGIDKLLLVSSNDTGDRSIHHISAIKAAQEAGVKHIVYTGLDIKNLEESAIDFLAASHAKTNDFLKGSGLKYTILNNTFYAETIPMFVGENVLKTGAFFPAGEGRVPFATRDDMAEAAANVLTSDGHENKEYSITADTTYSFGDVAAILCELSGSEVKYIDPPKDVFTGQLAKAGVPEMYAGFMAAFAEAVKNGEFDNPGTELQTLLQRKPTALKEYLKSVYFSKN